MAKSPKRKNSESDNGVSNKRSKSFEFGKIENGLEPSGSDFGGDLPTPFDTMVTEQPLALPKASSPSMNLGSPRNTPSSTTTGAKTEKTSTTTKEHGKKGGNDGTGKPQQSDPDKLSDALLSAGVDIREEEALLSSTVARTKAVGSVASNQLPPHPPFLHPKNVADFMKRVALEQNFNQDFNKNADILGLMSTACELYMRDIITNSLILSIHRRKGIKLNTGRRSEVSRSLRDLALRQKAHEERRVQRRIALGLEKQKADTRLDSEETQHRASNATANLMIAGGSKKKYSWLTAGSKSSSTDLKNQGNVSSAVAARGEMGIKYREAREEPGIVMRDLLLALENRRVGVNNVIAKGYARIRD